MAVDIREIRADHFASYTGVPIRFLVESVYEVDILNNGVAGFMLVERRVPEPYVKDYDGDESHRPTAWIAIFDTSSWGFSYLLTRETR